MRRWPLPADRSVLSFLDKSVINPPTLREEVLGRLRFGPGVRIKSMLGFCREIIVIEIIEIIIKIVDAFFVLMTFPFYQEPRKR